MDASKIDTYSELATLLEDENDLSQEHFENLFYLHLHGDTTSIDDLFTSAPIVTLINAIYSIC